MSFGVGVWLALVALLRHLLRSSLAIVGVVIGVAAVLTMVALGRGAREAVTEEVDSAGTNLVFVRAGNYIRGGDAINIPSGYGKATTLTAADAEAIAEIDGVELVTPEVDERAPLRAAEGTSFGPVLGAAASLPEVHGLVIRSGRFFTAAEVEAGAAVAVLGERVAEDLFGAEDPSGRQMFIRDESFSVLGVVRGTDAQHDETVFVPFPVLQASLGIDYLHGVTIAATQAGDTAAIAENVRVLLRERHRLDDPALAENLPEATGEFAMKGTGLVPDDFTVRTQAARALSQGLYTSAAAFVLASMPRLDQVTSEEMASTLARANQTMTLLLASIAAISLVVGGIGIMNVMLLAVTERTMEVGLRMSVGARTRDVLLQFLMEAVALSLLGGVLGIGLGLASAGAVTALLGWPTYVSARAVALAFGLAFAVGVGFGYYPALRASRLDPIDALRYE